MKFVKLILINLYIYDIKFYIIIRGALGIYFIYKHSFKCWNIFAGKKIFTFTADTNIKSSHSILASIVNYRRQYILSEEYYFIHLWSTHTRACARELSHVTATYRLSGASPSLAGLAVCKSYVRGRSQYREFNGCECIAAEMEPGTLARVLHDFFTTVDGELSLSKGHYFLVLANTWRLT